MRALSVSSHERPYLFADAAVSRYVRSLTLCTLMSAVTLVDAQSGGGYELHGTTQNAGGGALAGAGGYSLKGTIAQTDASPHAAMTDGNNYALSGGFWPGVAENDVIFRDGFELPLAN